MHNGQPLKGGTLLTSRIAIELGKMCIAIGLIDGAVTLAEDVIGQMGGEVRNVAEKRNSTPD